MIDDRDKEIEKLQKKIRKLEAALGIITNYSRKNENRMREQFEVVAETIPVPMIITDENEKIIFANLNAHKTFGYSPEDFIRVEASSLYNNPDDRKVVMEILSNSGEIRGFRTELKKSVGEVFPSVIFSQQLNFDGQNSFLSVVHDLTEIMALEKQLRQTQKMESIGKLASGIAHDFNNILAAIFGYTELIDNLLDLEKDKKISGYLDKIQKAATRAKSMIKQMMTFCRQSEREKRPFHISEIVVEVVKMMSELTPSDINIRSSIINKEMVVMGDPTQIHQVVTNLITNSVYALSGRGGNIDVTLKKANNLKEQRGEILLFPNLDNAAIYAEITVKDDGPGIDKEIIHNIFDPFFTTKPVGQGTGMGLSVVHGIVRGHNGYVRVESELEKGATFHCCFPVIEEKGENVIDEVKSRTVEKGYGRILLVDDEPMMLDVCNETLGNMGYHMSCCEESTKALEIFRTQPENFDLVITDNTMPEMSGTELSREILKICPDIPVIMITGNLFTQESELKNSGIKAFIQKPFDLKELQSVVRKILDYE